MTFGDHFSSTAAYGMEALGTFLLAVEAIKLKNLEGVRENVVQRIIKALSPRIIVADSATPAQVEQEKTKAVNGLVLVLMTVGVVVELFVIRFDVAGVWRSLVAYIPGPLSFREVVSAVLTGIVLVSFGYAVGALLYLTAITPFRILYNTLKWIDDKTDNGTIGILGFLLFLVGTLVHVYLSWVTE